MWPFNKSAEKQARENEQFGNECLNAVKKTIAREKEHFVNSPEELASRIITFATIHKADKICLSRGFRHTMFYDYLSMECNFIVDSKWYVLVTGECNDIKGSGGLHYSAGPADDGLAKCLLPKITTTKTYLETGKFDSGFIRGATMELYSPEDFGGILKFCKEFLKPVLEKNSTMR